MCCPAELQDRLETLKAMQPLLLCDREVILGGDFNCQVDKKDKMTTTTVTLDSSSEALKNLMQDFRLTDTFRFMNPSLPGYTWSNGTSKGLLVSNASVKPVLISDHD